MECEFCKSNLKSLSSLNYHKKTNKKCLELQNKKSDKIISLVLCNFCEKHFTKINKHLLTCKKKKEKDSEQISIENNESRILTKKLKSDYKSLLNKYKPLKEEYKPLKEENKTLKEENKTLKEEFQKLKDYIIELETERKIYKKDHETITSLAKQPKNSINNNNYNLSVYDDKIIRERFTLALTNAKPSDLYEGQKSIGRFVAPCLKNDDGTTMISCSDSSRNVFVYKDGEGNINKDVKCKSLATLIEPIATAKVDELMKEDDEKRRKMSKKRVLKNNVRDRIIAIEKLESHIIGYAEGTTGWMRVRSQIEGKQNENSRDLTELRILDNDETNYDSDCDFYDEKLVVAADDIKEMKKDSCKFSKTISEYV